MSEIIISIIGLILSVVMYFAGGWRTKRRIERNEREERITRVLDTYLTNARAHKIAEFDGLIEAGVGTLRDVGEIRDLFIRIEQNGLRYPLPLIKPQLQGIDLHLYFYTALKKRIKAADANSDQFIEKVRKIQNKGGLR